MHRFFKAIIKWTLRLMVLLGLLLGILMLLFPLPQLDSNRSVSEALSQEDILQTHWGRVLSEDQAQHPHLSGVYFLQSPETAFAARGKMAQEAEKTLDIQYYIWKKDTTGLLLLQAAYQAAERGVRVRLLLDDNGTKGLDAELMALDAHPNIEVRLFNPFVFRRFKALGFVTDFSRANRRMHNKSFTADNVVTVVGGRNIADEYFGATNEVVFADLDAIVIGEVVKDVSESFDDYWRSQSAYPIAQIVKPNSSLQQAALNALLNHHQQHNSTQYLQAIGQLKSVSSLLHNNHQVHWVPAQFIADVPEKGLGSVPKHQLLLHDMAQTLGESKKSLDVVSPYFVPTKEGTDYFINLTKQGVQVRIITNSMAATDVLPVHSGYAKYRKQLIKAGVQLYEMKPDPSSSQFAEQLGLIGSSGSSLHAKTFSSDQLRFFVGSFNFDPRSANLNTELGIVIDDAQIAAQMNELFEHKIHATSWQVHYDAANEQLQWHDVQNNTVLTQEPHSTAWQRGILKVLSWLPIEPLL